MRGSDSALTRPQVFSSLDLAGSGLLAFQGLSSAALVSFSGLRLARARLGQTGHVGWTGRLSQRQRRSLQAGAKLRTRATITSVWSLQGRF
jgi:hypothetical protein